MIKKSGLSQENKKREALKNSDKTKPAPKTYFKDSKAGMTSKAKKSGAKSNQTSLKANKT